MRSALASEGIKAAPPVTVTVGATILGVTLNEWVAIGTLVYLVLQAGFLLWQWRKQYKASK